ncbi:hypothetical protein Bca101_063694 [Brassica carinata]
MKLPKSCNALSLLTFDPSRKEKKKMGCMELGKKKKKLIRSIWWRIRAKVKKMRSPRDKNNKQTSFNYDPLSYSLNFDSP